MLTWFKKHRTLLTSLVIFFGMIAVCASGYFYGKEEGWGKSLMSNFQSSRLEKYDGAIFRTNFGDIEMIFLKTKAPIAVDNFIKISEKGLYDHSVFSRLTRDFIQITATSTIDIDLSKVDEVNDEKMLHGVAATVGQGFDVNGQFFILKASLAPWLEKDHTIFAKVINGFEVMDKIGKQAVDKNGVPKKELIIEKVILK